MRQPCAALYVIVLLEARFFLVTQQTTSRNDKDKRGRGQQGKKRENQRVVLIHNGPWDESGIDSYTMAL
jgi:hypothetical protein